MSQARVELYRLSAASARHAREHGDWAELPTLVDAVPGLRRDDPWGRPYRLEVAADGRTAVVRCCGDDGIAGTCDDVVSPVARTPAR